MMELKVELTRSGDEPWGFRLVGGADTEFALTVVKVLPNSSAEEAGLQNGDTVSSINGMTTKYMTHDDSRRALAEAKDSLVLGIARGLYDPVLDDWEPYYEEIDLEDSDQPSRPTEVFSPQQFTDVPTLGLFGTPNDPNLGGQSLGGTPCDPNLGEAPFGQDLGGLPQAETPYNQSGVPYAQSRGTTPFSKGATPFSRGTPFDPRLGTPGRESTASPFAGPTKPYRPFSTEPIDKIPPLEDPIILNPTYKDIFPDFGIDEDLLPKTRFKLPISEQYDPDGTKKKLKTQNKSSIKTDSITETKQEVKTSSTLIQFTTESKQEKKVESSVSEVKEEKKKEELKFKETVNKTNEEIDLANITISATNIVDESIERAVIVAEEIKKEIDVELHKTDKKVDTIVAVEEKSIKIDDSVNLTDKTTEQIFKQNAVKEITKEDVSKKSEHVKVTERIEALIDNKESVKAIEERKESIKHEIEDVVECGTVKQKLEVFEKEAENVTQNKVKKTSDVSKVDVKSYKQQEIQKKDLRSKQVDIKQSYVKSEKADVKQSSVKSEIKTEKSTSKLLAEQRAYIIGLQTIPNIRGSIHSSYHYNLLLKTFFIHLTDVMVALSRFILTEPVFNKEQEGAATEKTETIETEIRSYKEDLTEKENMIEKENVSKNREEKNLKQDVVLAEQEPQVVPVKEEIPKLAKTEIATEFGYENIEKRQKSNHTTAVMENVQEEIQVDKTEMVIGDASEIVSQQESKHTTDVLEKVREQVQKESLEENHAAEIQIHQNVSHHKISGSKMAQRVERKSEDLIQSMDSVIHEFQSKAAIEETSLAAETKEIQDYSERRSKSKERNTYVAVVESHTYTNKDVVLQEFLSGLSSLQSPEESKAAVQTLSTISTQSKTEENAQAVEVAKAVIEAAEDKKAFVETTEKKVAEFYEEARVSEQNFQKISEIISETIEESQKVEDYKQTEEFLATEKEEKIETEKLHQEVVAEVKQELKAVEEQNSKVEEKCAVVTLKRPQTLDLKLAEDPHIVKKKFELDISKSIQSELVSEDIKIAEHNNDLKTEKVQIHEDPHIIKKKFEIDISKSKQSELVSEDIKIAEHNNDLKTEIVQIHEDPHIVKKKFEIDISESKNSEVISEDMRISDQKTELKTEVVQIHKDPHMVKTKLEIEREFTAVDLKSEVKNDILAVTESKKSTATAQSTKSEISECKSAVRQSESTFQSFQSSQIERKQEFSNVAQKHIEQESTFVASSAQQTNNLMLNSQIAQEISQSQVTTATSIKTEEMINHITEVKPEIAKPIENGVEEAPIVPPTPLTDEYLFQLSIPFPRGVTPVPPDPSPEAEPLSGKDLIPHIETTLNSPILYDPPLPTPPGSNVTSPVRSLSGITSPGLKGGTITPSVGLKGGSTRPLERGNIKPSLGLKSSTVRPVYIKPGLRGGGLFYPVYTKPSLRGGADEMEFTKEEIMEIERKSSLLASAIDETIKSIEEYKEEVGLKKAAAREENNIDVEVKIATSFDSKTSTQQWCIVDQKVTNVSNGSLATTESSVTNSSNGDSPVTNGADTQVTTNIESNAVEINTNNVTNVTTNNTESPETNADENGTSIDLEEIKNQVAKLISTESFIKEERTGDPLEKYRPVKFDPEEIQNVKLNLRSAILSNGTNGSQVTPVTPTREMYKTESGEPLGTHQGIVDGLEEAVVEPEVANELGKPGLTEEKIAELISGEAEMLREAHVMGLSRVLTSHMSRSADDSSVDFKKIKPIINSLKDSEVLKALNDEVLEEMKREREKKRKEEQKSWTTFLQKPQRPVPKAKFGYHGYVEPKEEVEKPYTVKIVKQPKPKVAPDYKPKDFNTGLLPWEERALREPTPPPVEREEPLLVPEAPPEILEAVDPLPESEVPDLEDSGIPLPEPEPEKDTEEEEATKASQETKAEEEDFDLEAIVEETEKIVEENLVEEMEKNNLAEQLISNVQNMVDPNAPLEQQLAQMRAQIAALAQLPCVIQQSLDMVTKQLSQLSSTKEVKQSTETNEVVETHSEVTETTTAETEQTEAQEKTEEEAKQQESEEATEVVEERQQTAEVTAEIQVTEQETVAAEEIEKMKRDEAEMLEEQKRIEKQKKEITEQMRLDQEGRQLKQRPTPRVGKPKPVFGPVEPLERPLVLPGGRKWRNAKDVYTEEMFKEALQAQMESINGKTMGFYESPRLPYDQRINFMKYEKPPVSLDHLKESETYKMIHNMEQTPAKRVDMLTPVIAECDYREKCRSVTPCTNRMA